MARKRGKKRGPSIRERFITAHKEHVGMAITIWGTIGFITTVGLSGWNLRDIVITRPEVVRLHSDQEVKIARNDVRLQAVYDDRINNLRIQRDRLLRKEHLTEKEKRDLQDIEKQIEINMRLRDAK